MNVRFLTVAQKEVDDTVQWFNERAEGKGLEFLDELDRAIRRIRKFPLAAFEIETEIRRTLIARFPYSVVYGIDNETIVVIAVAHSHRKPDYWMDRILL